MRKQFAILRHIITASDRFLIVAHARPDPDAIGAAVALWHMLTATAGKTAVIACSDPFPSAFLPFLPDYAVIPLPQIDLADYRVIIGVDNIDRGFHALLPRCAETHVTVGIDHHPHTAIAPDLLITDPSASSTCEILADFFSTIGHDPDPAEAAALTVGILGDTRLFHNPNTSAHVLDTVATFMDHGVPLARIMTHAFLRKSPAILRLWGTALAHARYDTLNHAIITAIPGTALDGITIPATELKEELKEIASLLCGVPDAAFSLILMQIAPDVIKGSLRAEKDRGTDTTLIAGLFGGGGHHLASGFELPGTIVARGKSWAVV